MFKFRTLFKNPKIGYKTLMKKSFPRNLGKVFLLTHDQKKHETDVEYLKRCIEDFYSLVPSNDYYMFFLYSTFFMAKDQY